MLQFNFNPFPVLSTTRLLLRQMTIDDADDLFLMRSDANVMKYIPRPIAKVKNDVLETMEMIETNIQNNVGINWAMALKETNQMIGYIGYYRIQPENHRGEVGYMLSAQYHGKGYTYEALKAVLDYGFNEMKLHSIEAVIDPANIASERLLQKSNFVKEAHLKESGLWEDKYLDAVIYSLLKSNK
jgi:ribosomal-protein-alanine N-acetyltransferase